MSAGVMAGLVLTLVPDADRAVEVMCRVTRHAGGLTDTFRAAGLRDVEARAIEVATQFDDFDEYWTPFLAGVGVAPAYAISLEPDQRAAIRGRLRATLPFEADGSIHLTAWAWAARGRVEANARH